MSVTNAKEPQRKRSKRKSEDVVVQTEPINEEVPGLWESKKEAIGPLFSHLFSWDSILYRSVWKHEGPGIVFFFDCVFKSDMAPFKEKQRVATIMVNFAEGKMEIQEEDKSSEIFVASLFWGVSKCQKACQGNTLIEGSGNPDSTVSR